MTKKRLSVGIQTSYNIRTWSIWKKTKIHQKSKSKFISSFLSFTSGELSRISLEVVTYDHFLHFQSEQKGQAEAKSLSRACPNQLAKIGSQRVGEEG